MNEQPEIQSIEVVQPSSLEALERGTIDIQIATGAGGNGPGAEGGV